MLASQSWDWWNLWGNFFWNLIYDECSNRVILVGLMKHVWLQNEYKIKAEVANLHIIWRNYNDFVKKKPLKWLCIRDVSESVVGTIAVWSIFVDFRLNCVARDFAQAPKSKCHLFLRNRYQEKTHVYLEGVRIKREREPAPWWQTQGWVTGEKVPSFWTRWLYVMVRPRI